MRSKNLATNTDFDLKDIQIFNKLLPEEQHEVLEHRTCKTLKRSTVIFREQTRISGAYLIHNGIVKIYKTGIDGKEQILRFAQKGDMIGYRSVISEELACTTSQVLQDAEVSFVPESVIKRLAAQNSRFSMGLMRTACQELGEANSYILNIAQKTVRERLAEILLILKQDFGVTDDQHLMIALTREELANLIGTATESVIRLLSEFKQDELIELNGRKIKLLNEAMLQRRANMF